MIRFPFASAASLRALGPIGNFQMAKSGISIPCSWAFSYQGGIDRLWAFEKVLPVVYTIFYSKFWYRIVKSVMLEMMLCFACQSIV